VKNRVSELLGSSAIST